MLAALILGYRDIRIDRRGVIVLPLLAGVIMVAWDASMEAIWSTLDRAWIWRDGGSWFGVPLSNFFGWYLTAYLFYLAFAWYLGKNATSSLRLPASYFRAAIVCYGICGFGNLLIYRHGLFPVSAMDATGRIWMTRDILVASTLVSVFGMGSLAVLAWMRCRAGVAQG